MKMGLRGWFEALHVGALGIWLGAVVMAGAVAAMVFPTVHALNPVLPEYESYNGDHWMVVAGKVANASFMAADYVQLGCAFVAAVTLFLMMNGLKRTVRPWPLLARMGTLLLVLGVLGFNFVVLRPRMERNVTAFWSAAHAGNNDQAKAYEAAFRADHPTATTTMGLTAGGLLLCIAAVGWSWSGGGVSGRSEAKV